MATLLKLEKEELEDRKARAVDTVVARILDEADSANVEESRLYGQEGYPDPVFADCDALPYDRLARIQKAIAVVEKSELERRQKLQKRRAALTRQALNNRKTSKSKLHKTKRKSQGSKD